MGVKDIIDSSDQPTGYGSPIYAKHQPLADAGVSMYAAETTWSGSVHLTPEDLAEWMARPDNPGYSEDDAAPGDAERVIVLGPVN